MLYHTFCQDTAHFRIPIQHTAPNELVFPTVHHGTNQELRIAELTASRPGIRFYLYPVLYLTFGMHTG